MLIEYKIRFNRRGMTITQRIDSDSGHDDAPPTFVFNREQVEESHHLPDSDPQADQSRQSRRASAVRSRSLGSGDVDKAEVGGGDVDRAEVGAGAALSGAVFVFAPLVIHCEGLELGSGDVDKAGPEADHGEDDGGPQ